MPAANPHLIVLLGPTGVGKTNLSIELARNFNAPIISCDSRQFFREMKIGTAYPSNEILKSVPHYFVGNKSIQDRYSCGMFEVDALALMNVLYRTHQNIMLVGGSGLYIDAICDGIDDFPTPDPEIRWKLENQLKQDGIESLRMQLKILDPDYYNKVDLKNTQRIIKALEVCIQTGKTYTSFLTNPSKKREFKTIKVGLNRPREELYRMIDQRVDKMVADGLVDEVIGLKQFKHLNALKTVGYQEIFDYIDGSISLDQAVDLIKRNTRRYAKRQLTWWARDNEITWFHPDQRVELINFVSERLK